MAIDKNSKFFVTGIDTLRDPVRNTRWRLLIPGKIFTASYSINPSENLKRFAADDTGDDFALHVKDCKLPTIESTTKQIFYMGFAQNHVVAQKGLDGEMDFNTILLEDMAAYEAMLTWNQVTLNSGILNGLADTDTISAGALSRGLGLQKDVAIENLAFALRNQTIKVELYNWMNGSVIYTLNLINAMPVKVGDFSTDLKYTADADIMNFKFKLKYDRWTVTIPTEYKNNTTLQD